MIIAVDFDGTIAEEQWPDIGPEIPGAIDALRELHTIGHKLILYTLRERQKLVEAILWLRDRGASELFDEFNDPHPDYLRNGWPNVRKIAADVYIDDRAVGCPKDSWGRVDWRGVLEQLNQGIRVPRGSSIG